MRMARSAIKGSRGSWFAEWNGERLPVLHNSWRVDSTFYRDPMVGAPLAGKRYRDLVEALSTGSRAIMQRDRDETLARNGYVGVFTYTDFEVEDDGAIHLTLKEQIG